MRLGQDFEISIGISSTPRETSAPGQAGAAVVRIEGGHRAGYRPDASTPKFAAQGQLVFGRLREAATLEGRRSVPLPEARRIRTVLRGQVPKRADSHVSPIRPRGLAGWLVAEQTLSLR